MKYWPISAFAEPSEPRTIDLSFLNDPIEKHGFVKMTGGDLQFSDGTPVRFFGPNVSFWQGNLIYMDHLSADRFADLVSRLGANCVRLHIMHATNSLIDPDRDDTQEFDAQKLDRLEYLIAALGKRNVYVNLRPHVPSYLQEGRWRRRRTRPHRRHS
ncbi:MAG: cellulase family glycosylhydrolase [Nocardioides sp.]